MVRISTGQSPHVEPLHLWAALHGKVGLGTAGGSGPLTSLCEAAQANVKQSLESTQPLTQKRQVK